MNLTLEACGANNTRRQLCRTPLVLCSLPIKTEQRVTRGASLLMAMIATFFCATAGANVLFWDAGNTNGNGLPITAGSGGWDTDTTTNFNWNDGTTNLSWAQTSTTSGTMGAIFGGPDAAAGTYTVTMDGTQVAATNLQINANG
ncbi:MAG TPA: hypothetical protein VH598_14570, partial [Verrucomicrobiae bacterium]|nr:hypothetical protein [Verrucomicrobiae bacterium]